jgi:hypothetical protein
MFSCFPQSPDINPDAYLQGLSMACEGVSDAAICQAVKDVISGKADGVGSKFCPSTAEFGAYARKIHEHHEIIKRSHKWKAIAHEDVTALPIVQEGTAEERQERVAAILSKFKKEPA